MRKSSKPQWDFGELFPVQAARHVLTVSEVTTQVKRLLEKELGRIWVSGEVSNLRVQGSGHIYFTLKDPASLLSCVCFRGDAAAGREHLEDGRKVLLQGDLTVYEPRGQYQLIVRSLELQGAGALQVAFEKLKAKLNAEGLFATDRKRPLPRYPARIGLVTSPTGAALRDVLHVIQRRDPGLEIVLAPCRVQGEGAGAEIAAAINLLNQWSLSGTVNGRASERKLDLILLTRGGGSIEDLWAFNEEGVARAVFDSTLPVISAVGHEIDFTISDFVADLRAATPSAAAEVITEGIFSSREFVSGAPDLMRLRLRRRLARAQEWLASWEGRIARAHPRTRIGERLQWIDDLQATLRRIVWQRRRECRVAWQTAQQRFRRLRPGLGVARFLQSVTELDRRLREQPRRHARRHADRLLVLEARLRLLSPEGVLNRGYSITTDARNGRVIRDAAEVTAGMRLKSRLKRGEVWSVVERADPEPPRAK